MDESRGPPTREKGNSQKAFGLLAARGVVCGGGCSAVDRGGIMAMGG